MPSLEDQFIALEIKHHAEMKEFLGTDKVGYRIMHLRDCTYTHSLAKFNDIEYLMINCKLHGHGGMTKRKGGDTGAERASEPPTMADNADRIRTNDPKS